MSDHLYCVVRLGLTISELTTLEEAIEIAKPHSAGIAKYDLDGNFIGWLWASNDYKE